MSSTSIGLIIWLLGVIVAWFQIKSWNKDHELTCPRDYVVLLLLCLLSWMIYPIRFLDKNNNRIE